MLTRKNENYAISAFGLSTVPLPTEAARFAFEALRLNRRPNVYDADALVRYIENLEEFAATAPTEPALDDFDFKQIRELQDKIDSIATALENLQPIIKAADLAGDIVASLGKELVNLKKEEAETIKELSYA